MFAAGQGGKLQSCARNWHKCGNMMPHQLQIHNLNLFSHSRLLSTRTNDGPCITRSQKILDFRQGDKVVSRGFAQVNHPNKWPDGPMWAAQSRVPKLPIPPLEDTIERLIFSFHMLKVQDIRKQSNLW